MKFKNNQHKGTMDMARLIKITGIFSIVFGAWAYGKDVINLSSVIAGHAGVMSNYLYGLTAFLLLVIIVAAGIGMLLHKKWGWFAGLFSYTYLSVSNIVGAASLITVLDEISQFYMLYIFQNIMFMVIGVMIVFFLLNDEVLNIFSVDHHRHKGYALMAMIASVLITSLLNILTYKIYLG